MAQRGAILLVDSFPDERDMYAEFLRFSGFDLEICPLAARALSLAAERPIAAVVTRIRQPGTIDGIELTRQLKNEPRTREIPVVIITTDPSHHALAIEAGCDRFILLPCLPDALAGELQQLLQQSET